MKRNSGEIVIGLLAGLLIGAASLFVVSGNHAQRVANETGQSTSLLEYPRENPGKSALWVVTPTLAGAGIGWAIDGLSSDSKKQENKVYNINAGNNVVITGDGDSTVVIQDIQNDAGPGYNPQGGF